MKTIIVFACLLCLCSISASAISPLTCDKLSVDGDNVLMEKDSRNYLIDKHGSYYQRIDREDIAQEMFFSWVDVIVLGLGAAWGFSDAMDKKSGAAFVGGMACVVAIGLRFDGTF